MGCGGSKLPRPHSTYDGRKKPKAASAKRRAISLVSLRSDAIEILSNEVNDSESQLTKKLDFVQSKPNRLKDNHTYMQPMMISVNWICYRGKPPGKRF